MEGTTVLTRSLVFGKDLGWDEKNALQINGTPKQKLHGVCLTTAAVVICTTRSLMFARSIYLGGRCASTWFRTAILNWGGVLPRTKMKS